MTNIKGNTFSEANMKRKNKRKRAAMIATRRMTNVSRLEVWIAMYPNLKAGKPKLNNEIPYY